jgi:hypothetical protein
VAQSDIPRRDAQPPGPAWDDVDWLDIEPAAGGAMAPPRRPWPKWLTIAVLGAVVAVAVAVTNLERRAPSAAHTSSTPTSTAPSSSSSASSTAPKTSAAQPTPHPALAVSVTRLGHPLLGASAGWELFGRGDQVLVRIEPAAGRITRTTIPVLLSSGPVFLVAGSDRVVIRPLDRVPGYVVPDGQPARQQSQVLNLEGPVFPGPTADQMWMQPADDHQPVMALTTLNGRRLPGFIPVPPESSPFEAAADGAGYLLFPGIGGLYDARPDGLRRISTGSLLAVGPTGWLTLECDSGHRCHPVLISRENGARQVVNTEMPLTFARGVLSPDGTTAAMMTAGPNGTVGFSLLDLTSGHRKVFAFFINQMDYQGAVAFSPDSKWLFVITADGSLSVIDPKTGAIRSLGAALPPLGQLVIRSTAGR